MSKVTIKQTLAVVNDARVALNMIPLKQIPIGFVSEPDECPIHNAFGELRVDVLGDHLQLASRDKARIMAQTWGTRVIDGKAVNEKNLPLRNELDEKLDSLVPRSDDNWDAYFEYEKEYDALMDNLPVFGGTDQKRWVVVAPKEIKQFVNRFDKGDFPSLIPTNR